RIFKMCGFQSKAKRPLKKFYTKEFELGDMANLRPIKIKDQQTNSPTNSQKEILTQKKLDLELMGDEGVTDGED
ncbi:unnamed protein product, partial [Dovyalis caffra]